MIPPNWKKFHISENSLGFALSRQEVGAKEEMKTVITQQFLWFCDRRLCSNPTSTTEQTLPYDLQENSVSLNKCN